MFSDNIQIINLEKKVNFVELWTKAIVVPQMKQFKKHKRKRFSNTLKIVISLIHKYITERIHFNNRHRKLLATFFVLNSTHISVICPLNKFIKRRRTLFFYETNFTRSQRLQFFHMTYVQNINNIVINAITIYNNKYHIKKCNKFLATFFRHFNEQGRSSQDIYVMRCTAVRLLSLSSSFHRAPPKLKKIYYEFTKEKDQIIFSHIVSFFNTGG